MKIVPKQITELSDNLASLPSIGPKTAFRLAIYLALTKPSLAKGLISSLEESVDNLTLCTECGNVADIEDQQCNICSDPSRGGEVIIVETVMDLINIEQVGRYQGLYHVLHGLVSPVQGRALEDINSSGLVGRLRSQGIDTMIFALPSSIEGDTTVMLIKKEVGQHLSTINFFRLGRGLPSGTSIEFLDASTLINSLDNKTTI